LLKKEYSELTRLDTEYSKHKSGLIIYNPGIKKKKIDKYASNIDVLPTLLNMFGVEYDSRLLIGQDIMSDSEGIVIFNDHSFITKKGYYNEKGNNTLKDKQKEVFNKINASSLIFDTNYYQFVRSSEDEK
jgi:phosphoglycerol transferase MdoB-like AlkP superfamily enzyme